KLGPPLPVLLDLQLEVEALLLQGDANLARERGQPEMVQETHRAAPYAKAPERGSRRQPGISRTALPTTLRSRSSSSASAARASGSRCETCGRRRPSSAKASRRSRSRRPSAGSRRAYSPARTPITAQPLSSA